MSRRLIPSLSVLALAVACGKAPAPQGPATPPPSATAALSAPVDAVAEAAASYRVTAAIAPASLPRGGKATLSVAIEPTRADVHVQAEFPLKITLAASPGLAAGKDALGHADAVDRAAKGRRWEVPVTAQAAGAQHVEAALRFALCKETEPLWCVTRSETVRAELQVR